MLTEKMNEITSILQKYLWENNFSESVNCGLDFCAFPNFNEVEWSMLIVDKHDELFVNHAINIGLIERVDTFILSFFHEVGHCETYYMLSKFDKIKIRLQKFFLENFYCFFRGANSLCEKYYNFKDEDLATRWAIEYINEHPTDINILWNQILNIVHEIYASLINE